MKAKTCWKCNGSQLARDDKYDAYYCVPCRVWNEERCTDAKCEFCAGRPETPPVPSSEERKP